MSKPAPTLLEEVDVIMSTEANIGPTQGVQPKLKVRPNKKEEIPFIFPVFI